MSFHSPKRIRRSISQGKTQLDEEVIILYKKVIKNIQSGYSNEEILPHNEENFKIIFYIMTKMLKTDNEIFLIKLYLQNLEKFIAIFHESSIPLKNLLEKIANEMLLESINENSMICKTGDKGDKVYLLLKGSVSVLLQKEIIVSISKIDFICYLVKLHLFQENELISRILMINREKFGVDEKELNLLFSMFHLYKFFIDHKIKKQMSLFCYFYEFNSSIKDIIRDKLDLAPEKVLHLGGMDDFMMNDIWNFYNNLYDAIIENYNQNQIKEFNNSTDNNINHNSNNKVNVNSKKNSSLSFRRSSLKPRLIKISASRNSLLKKSMESIIEEVLFSPSIPNEVIYNTSKENYKKRFIPNIIEKIDLVEFKLFEYIEITNLTEGDIFGEIALQNSTKKRTATIISNEDCVFGTLTKNLYNYCLRSTQEKIRFNLIQFFLNGPIFKGINQFIFEGKYYNWFIKKKYKNRKVLFKQGDIRQKIFFIIKGELKLNTKLSFQELNNIIEYNGGEKNDILARKYCYESIDFDKYYNDEIQVFKLGCFKDNEIIGLDNFIKDKKFFCDCEVNSISVSLYELEDNLYQNLLYDIQLRTNIENYVEQKKKILCERLKKIRDTKIENAINNIRNSNQNKKNIYNKDNKVKKGNLIYSLMRSIKLNKKIKLNKLPDIDALSINAPPKSRNITSYNKNNFNTFLSEKEISNIISSSLKNENENNSYKKKTRNCNSNSNIEDNTIYSMTNLKFFKRKNFSVSEAKNILTKKPLISLKHLRTKQLIIPNGNNIKVIKKRYNEKKLLNKEEEFYMTHTEIFSNVLKSHSVRKKEFVNVLFLDNWAEKHYKNPQTVKQYIPKLRIRNKSFNINT